MSQKNASLFRLPHLERQVQVRPKPLPKRMVIAPLGLDRPKRVIGPLRRVRVLPSPRRQFPRGFRRRTARRTGQVPRRPLCPRRAAYPPFPPRLPNGRWRRRN
jgi:hypothetical protein